MKAKNIKVGQVVALKSGGPFLTVANILDKEDGTVECIRFNNADTDIDSFVFRAAMLELLVRIED